MSWYSISKKLTWFYRFYFMDMQLFFFCLVKLYKSFLRLWSHWSRLGGWILRGIRGGGKIFIPEWSAPFKSLYEFLPYEVIFFRDTMYLYEPSSKFFYCFGSHLISLLFQTPTRQLLMFWKSLRMVAVWQIMTLMRYGDYSVVYIFFRFYFASQVRHHIQTFSRTFGNSSIKFNSLVYSIC